VAAGAAWLDIPELGSVIALAADIQVIMAVYLCSATKGQGVRICMAQSRKRAHAR
jgi:hypothetical protein